MLKTNYDASPPNYMFSLILFGAYLHTFPTWLNINNRLVGTVDSHCNVAHNKKLHTGTFQNGQSG